MNQVIKFRAKSKLNGKWHYGSLITIDGNDQSRIVPIGEEYDDIIPSMIRVISHTAGQFIGLHDKTGKEIYCGDLVKAKRANSGLGDMDDLYEIVYHERYALYCYKCVRCDMNDYRVGKIAEGRTAHPYFISPAITEVIGNIHDNQDLIHGK